MRSRRVFGSPPIAAILAVVGVVACSDASGPHPALVGDWAGEAPTVGGQALFADLQVDSAASTKVYGAFSEGERLAGGPSACRSAVNSGVAFVGHGSADDFAFDLPCAAGTPCTAISFHIHRISGRLELSSTVDAQTIPLTPC